MKIMKSETGVTLIALVITIAVLSILSFTVVANIDGLSSARNKANFEEDVNKLTEAVEQYFARQGELPIANAYTNVSMLQSIKNTNDNASYYVLDIIRMIEYNLHYGKDYLAIKQLDATADVSSYTDVYIINKASHTIYYPKGIEYDGEIHYSLKNTYSKVNIPVSAVITFSGDKNQSENPIIQAEIKHNSYTDIDVQNCGWVFTNESTPIGTDRNRYANSFQTAMEELNVKIETPIIPEGTDGHTHTGNSKTGGGCYTKAIYHAHTDPCYATCDISKGGCEGGPTKDDSYYNCPAHDTHSSCGMGTVRTTIRHHESETHKTGYHTTHRYLTCTKDGTIERYELGCGIDIGETSANYYLHVLTADTDGNVTETVSAPVRIKENRHKHSGTSTTGSGCYTKAVNHTHAPSCYGICTVSKGGCEGGPSRDDRYLNCPAHDTHYNCGAGTVRTTIRHHDSESHKTGYTTTHEYLNCSKGGSIDHYELTCGKQDGDIQSYEINF